MDRIHKLQLGELFVTRGIIEMLTVNPSFASFVNASLSRYVRRDWGEMDDEDKVTNDCAADNGARILATYKDSDTDTDIWIITEWDRSATTILLPDEY